MVVKLFQLNNKCQAKLPSGIYYESLDGEKLSEFKSRVKAAVLDVELEEAEFTFIGLEKMRAEKALDLQEAYKTAVGLEAELIALALYDKGVLVTPKKAAKAVVKVDPAKAKKKVAKEAAPEPVAPKKAKKEEAAPAKKETPTKKESTVNPPYTLADAEADFAEALTKKKTYIRFLPYGATKTVIGYIRGITLDKKTPLVLFRISLEDGTVTHKTTNHPSIKFDVKKDEQFELAKVKTAELTDEEVEAVSEINAAFATEKAKLKETLDESIAKAKASADAAIEKAKADYDTKLEKAKDKRQAQLQKITAAKTGRAKAQKEEAAKKKAAAAKAKKEANIAKAKEKAEKAAATAKKKADDLKAKIAKYEEAGKAAAAKLKNLK